MGTATIAARIGSTNVPVVCARERVVGMLAHAAYARVGRADVVIVTIGVRDALRRWSARTHARGALIVGG